MAPQRWHAGLTPLPDGFARYGRARLSCAESPGHGFNRR
ncbi:hypothetical protein [Azospirillum argentinense]